MKVRIFAKFREIARSDYVEIEASNVKDLKEKISKLFNVDPSEVILIINGHKMPEEEKLVDVKEAVAFPPTAGGC